MSALVPQMTSMLAAPTTSMLAAPAAYGGSYAAAAPTMTSMYATPGASMYMPTNTVAAAVPQVVAAPTMTQVVAAPQVVETVVPAASFGVQQPMSLIANLTPPDKLKAEEAAYVKALDAQFNKQRTAVLQEADIKKKMLEQEATTSKLQYQLQIEEQLKMAMLQIDQEANTTCNGLQEAAITQQTAVSEKAAIGIATYNTKKAMEEMAGKAWQEQKKWYDEEMKLTAQYEQVRKAGSKAVVTPAMAPPVAPVMTAPVVTQAPSYVAQPQMVMQAPVTTMAAPVSYAPTTAMASPVTTAMAAPVSYAPTTAMASPVTTAMPPLGFGTQRIR